MESGRVNLPAFSLDVASLFAGDPERGRRVLDLMRRHDIALTAEWIGQMRAYAEKVWHGLEPRPGKEQPKRLG